MESFKEDILPMLQEYAVTYGLKILAALVIFVIGRWVAKALRGVARKVMTKRNVDPTVVKFVCSLIYVTLLVFVILAAIGQLGVQTTSFIPVIGAAGLAIGLALQGSLANFAAGFLLIIFRPFKVGDYIEAGGTAGVVEEVQVFTTKLKTPDNKLIIIPNSKITGDNITNYSAKDTRRVDFTFGVGYGDDIDKVRSVLNELIAADSRILKDPEHVIVVSELADSSVNFTVRVWAKTSDYWNIYFDLTEAAKKRFDADGISIPFPQRDVHMFQETA
jgi:small conductance mechanosensitive channel